MKILTFAGQKGGAGKSTLAVALAGAITPHLSRKGQTLLLDTDYQRSIELWSMDREHGAQPQVLQMSTTDVAHCIKEVPVANVDYMLIDTPGKADEVVISIAKQSDLLIVPTRVSAFDFAATMLTIGMANDRGIPCLIVINGLRPYSGRKFAEIKEAYEAEGAMVAPMYISQRAAYIDCVFESQTPQEYEADHNGKATTEVADLLEYITGLIGGKQLKRVL